MSILSSVITRLPGTGRFFTGWRGLRNFWATVAVALGVVAGIVQALGPPQAPVTAAILPGARSTVGGPPGTAGAPDGQAGHPRAAVAAPPPVAVARTQNTRLKDELAARDQPGPIAEPDPALMEPAEDSRDMLPRIAEGGRKPMQVYAAGFDASNRQPRIAVLLAGYGLSEADSMRAARVLPGGVSFAVSPYGATLTPALAAARSAQHEYLVSIPMEPQGYPLNDPGDQGLMTNAGRSENMKRLLWSMSRFGGYVGVTGALGDLRGERFAGLSDQMEPVLRQVARRGLLYVDPRPGQTPPNQVWGRIPDLVIDEPATAQAIDARLGELEAIARERGSAMGLAGAPRPVTIDRIAAWTEGLAAKGLALAPVSAVVQPPSRAAIPVRQAPEAGDEAADLSDPGAAAILSRTAARSRTPGE